MKRGASVRVWVTWACNLKCVYCNQPHEKGRMTEETLEATVAWISKNGVQHIGFFGGEPLTHPYGVKYLLAKTETSYGLTTNGTILSQDLYAWLRLHGVKVSLSLDGVKEVQDRFRDGSYDQVMSNLDWWRELTVNVLMTLTDPEKAYVNVAHVRDLGFPGCYMNNLHPYGYGYDEKALASMEGEYRRIIKDLHRPPRFSVNDFTKFARLVKRRPILSRGCGINRRGIGISPDGLIYPCHRGMEMGADFAIGSVWNGVDPARERRVREQVGAVPEKCRECPIGCLPCPVACYRAHGEFGVDPEDWYCESMKARMRVVAEHSQPRMFVTPAKPRARDV